MSSVPDIGAVLWPGATTGSWGGRGSGRDRLVAMPSAADMRQAIPWRMSSVLATGRRASDDRPRRRQARDAVGAAGLLTVGALARGRRVGAVRAGSLVEHVANALGMPHASGIVLCGPPRANQKPVVQLHDRCGRPLAYVKVAWNDLTRGLLDDEANALEHLGAVGIPAIVVPPVLARGVFGDATWLAIGPVTVARRASPDLADVDRIAVAIERTSVAWEGVTGDSPYLAELRTRAAGLAAADEAVRRATERWAAAPVVLGASHGDYVPWNMLTGTPASAVWDWERYERTVPIGFDRLHYRLQVGVHRMGQSVGEAVSAIDADLAAILPDLTDTERRAHLDWYLVDLLCRYEHDAGDHPTPRLRELVAQLTDVSKGRAST